MIEWRKSSFTNENSCVEVANLGSWRKATHSEIDNCVEVADLDSDCIGVRDSKLGDNSPVLHFTRAEMAAWVKGCNAGEFDDLV